MIYQNRSGCWGCHKKKNICSICFISKVACAQRTKYFINMWIWSPSIQSFTSSIKSIPSKPKRNKNMESSKNGRSKVVCWSIWMDWRWYPIEGMWRRWYMRQERRYCCYSYIFSRSIPQERNDSKRNSYYVSWICWKYTVWTTSKFDEFVGGNIPITALNSRLQSKEM